MPTIEHLSVASVGSLPPDHVLLRDVLLGVQKRRRHDAGHLVAPIFIRAFLEHARRYDCCSARLVREKLTREGVIVLLCIGAICTDEGINLRVRDLFLLFRLLTTRLI